MASSVIIAIIFFGLIIFVHELGHFLTARLFGVQINEFAIGMGPKIFSKSSKKSGTNYSLRLFPVGGFVSMDGEDEESSNENAFCNKPKWQRFIILFSGAFMNVLLGFIIILLCTVSADKIYSNEISSFLVADSNGEILSEYQGLFPGDEIMEINGTDINVRYDYLFTAMRMKDRPCTLTVKRDDATVVLENFVFPTTTEDGVVFGNPSFFIPAERDKNVFTVLHETSCQTVAVVKMVIFSLYDLVSGEYTADSVSGPVGVVSEISETAEYGFDAILTMIALITINIGVFNLLPFPALDGGRILFLGIEAVIRRPINKSVEAFVNFMGLMILFGFMILITYNDIVKLIM